MSLELFVASGVIPSSTVPAFSPSDIPDLEIWVDASDAGTITETANRVSRWDDKSGNGNHFEELVGSQQPLTNSSTINGLNAIYFDGVNRKMKSLLNVTTTANSFTIIAVVTKANVLGFKYVAAVSPDRYIFFGARDNNFASFYGNGASWGDVNANTPLTSLTTGANCIMSVQNGTDNPFVNGVALNVAGGGMASNTSKFHLGTDSAYGSAQVWQGDIAELAIYNRALNASEIISIQDYFINKWGI